MARLDPDTSTTLGPIWYPINLTIFHLILLVLFIIDIDSISPRRHIRCPSRSSHLHRRIFQIPQLIFGRRSICWKVQTREKQIRAEKGDPVFWLLHLTHTESVVFSLAFLSRPPIIRLAHCNWMLLSFLLFLDYGKTLIETNPSLPRAQDLVFMRRSINWLSQERFQK